MAFRSGDPETAYAQASPHIRSIFPTSGIFMGMVKAGYAALIRPRRHFPGPCSRHPATGLPGAGGRSRWSALAGAVPDVATAGRCVADRWLYAGQAGGGVDLSGHRISRLRAVRRVQEFLRSDRPRG
ncbi:MAG: hypothetical protein Ct9H300mP16_02730 [Pseudomonadota bacterium]|nr:MAG: hypothetical protein Ct9H300mP16_02730 [Pseudomonadota bacterium]